MTMELKEICVYEYAFTADDERGFSKLKNNQQADAFRALVTELVSNALDAAADKKVEIALTFIGTEAKPLVRFAVKDSGAHMTQENLEALHVLGASSKREEKEKYIGRFGVGFTTAFHDSLRTVCVEIETNLEVTPGVRQPYRIFYDCKDPTTIPLWSFHPLEEKQTMTTVSVVMRLDTIRVAKRHLELIHYAIQEFLERTTFPICYNGKLYQRDLDAQLRYKGEHVYVVQQDGHTKVRLLAILDHGGIKARDEMEVIVRGMTIEKGPSPTILSYAYSDKSPLNYYSDNPFLRDEIIIVETDKLEVTISRNKLVRNPSFYEMQELLEKARVEALLQIIRRYQKRQSSYHLDMIVANLYLLRCQLHNYLANKSYKESLKPLLEELLQLPVFPIWESRSKFLSIRDILAQRNVKKPLFYAVTADDAEKLLGTYEHDFVLQEFYACYWEHIYRFGLVSHILKSILEGIDGIEVIELRSLVEENRDVLHRLIDAGVINLHRLLGKYEVTSVGGRVRKFIDELENVLQHKLIRKAFTYAWLEQIVVVPVKFMQEGPQLPLAFFMESQGKQVSIGVNVDAPLIKSLAKLEDMRVAAFSFIPLLCHQLVYYWWTLQDYFLTRFSYAGFEDFLLEKTLKVLLGEEELLSELDEEDNIDFRHIETLEI